MKLLTKSKPRKPSNGSERRIVKFAFLPKDLDNGVTVWLESYVSQQSYVSYASRGNGDWVECCSQQLNELQSNANVANNPKKELQ